MKIVVLDGKTLNPGDNPWDPVAELGELTVFDVTPRDKIVPRAVEADVVITNKTPLDVETLLELPSLRLISVLATGYDNVDIAAARARGITVCNVPDYATDSVAQHVFALLLELCHRTAVHDWAVREGEWQQANDFTFWKVPPLELRGLVMGIVGYGRIGKRVAELAHAFGMRVLACTPNPGRPPGWRPFSFCDLGTLFESSDVITLHCPLTEETQSFIDGALLVRAKRSAYLINTARGRLIDEHALAAALAEGWIAGAGLDVVAREPIREDSPLLRAPNCVITPHMAWASLAARRRLMLATAENIRQWLGGRPTNVVR